MCGPARTIRIVLVGGSGYTGFEVVRCLLRHPNAQVVGLYGEKSVGPMDSFFPLLTKQVSLVQELFDADKIAGLNADVAIMCVPHKVAMNYARGFRKLGLRVIDLSADYRLHDPVVYEKWYCKHEDPAGLKDAVYGLPEWFAGGIAKASLVANPGCYPTCSALPLAPVLKAGLVKPTGIVISAVSGISGAGRTASPKHHFPERNENFEPYGVGEHRHMPEIEQTLTDLAGRPVELLFQPHLSPMDRGMLCSIYADPAGAVTQEQLIECLKAAYDNKPFVRVRTDVLPATKYTSGTNFCDLTARMVKGKVVLFSALDNLLKGASGQAVQNMNIMFGLDETAGLI